MLVAFAGNGRKRKRRERQKRERGVGSAKLARERRWLFMDGNWNSYSQRRASEVTTAKKTGKGKEKNE